MNSGVCECCGSAEQLSTSMESVEGYEEKILVEHCRLCDLSYYQEPNNTNFCTN